MASLFRINSNVQATFAQRQLNQANSTLNEANQRLASGERINSAADDAAGLAISEGLSSQIRGLGQAERNAQDGISVLQTAEGGFESIQGKLQRMRELSVQAANDSLTTSDRENIQTEIDQLSDEITRTAESVEFNTKELLTKDAGSLTFHVGANKDQTITVEKSDIGTGTSKALGVDGVDVTTRSGAESAISTVDSAIGSVSTNRANIGAIQNRLEGTIDFLQVQQENFQASESRIRDADVAEETVKRTRANILTQAGTSVLSQAQQSPQLALQLI
jgi:flagellin